MDFVNRYGLMIAAFFFFAVAIFQWMNGSGTAPFVAVGVIFLALGSARAKKVGGGRNAR